MTPRRWHTGAETCRSFNNLLWIYSIWCIVVGYNDCKICTV